MSHSAWRWNWLGHYMSISGGSSSERELSRQEPACKIWGSSGGLFAAKNQDSNVEMQCRCLDSAGGWQLGRLQIWTVLLSTSHGDYSPLTRAFWDVSWQIMISNPIFSATNSQWILLKYIQTIDQIHGISYSSLKTNKMTSGPTR